MPRGTLLLLSCSHLGTPPCLSSSPCPTAYRPLAGASPAEESLSSGFAERGQSLLSAHLGFRQNRLEAWIARSGSNDRLTERVGATKHAFVTARRRYRSP